MLSGSNLTSGDLNVHSSGRCITHCRTVCTEEVDGSVVAKSKNDACHIGFNAIKLLLAHLAALLNIQRRWWSQREHWRRWYWWQRWKKNHTLFHCPIKNLHFETMENWVGCEEAFYFAHTDHAMLVFTSSFFHRSAFGITYRIWVCIARDLHLKRCYALCFALHINSWVI